MGFGILFIGYFLLLNLTYYGFTDLIAALVMLMAAYNLRTVNKYFSMAIVPIFAFCLISVGELIVSVATIFGQDFLWINDYTAPARYLCIGFLTERILTGITAVAAEVDASATASRARLIRPFAIGIFALATVLQFPYVDTLIPLKPLAVIAVIVVLLIFLVLLATLYSIYSAYRWICMPEDVDNDVKDKRSRIGFVNKFREHELEKSREYAEYKLNKIQKKSSKKKRKK